MMLDLNREFTVQTIHGVGQKTWTVRPQDRVELDAVGVFFHHSETSQIVLIPWPEVTVIRQDVSELVCA